MKKGDCGSTGEEVRLTEAFQRGRCEEPSPVLCGPREPQTIPYSRSQRHSTALCFQRGLPATGTQGALRQSAQAHRRRGGNEERERRSGGKDTSAQLQPTLRNIVGPLRRTMTDISRDLNNLVTTFRLSEVFPVSCHFRTYRA